MKVLNRPMFRMGGPIKEGIMSGIKEPRQKYQDAGSVFKNVQATLQAGEAADPAVLNEAAKLGIGNPYKNYNYKTSSLFPKVIVPRSSKNIETDQLAEEVERIDPVEGLTELQKAKLGKTFIGTQEYRDKVEELEALEKANQAKAASDGTVITQGKSPFAYTADEVIKTGGKVDSGDDDPPPATKKERINTILEGLGYDRAQKNALYDAMIKAGQRISRTGLGAENLVSDVIAETSQSYDKPEKLREAANLMDVQQQLKLDQIEAGKTNTTEQTVDFLMSDKGGNKTKTEALDIVLKNPRNDDEAYDKAFAETKGDVGRAVTAAVNYAVERNLFDKPLGIIDTKKYNNPKEFFEDKTVYKGPGNYIIGGTVIEIDSKGNATTVKKYYTSKKSESFLAKFGIGTD
jgi:hypothetical protein